MVRTALVSACLLFVTSLPAQATPILVNGSFELGPPDFTDHDIDILSGSTEITGWTVTGAGIDLLGPPWDVQHGRRAIDLDLRAPGGIKQTFATNIGRGYRVRFWLSGNPQGGTTQKAMRVAAAGVSSDYRFDVSGPAIEELSWELVTFRFIASDISSTLSFTSLSDGSSAFGALIEDVRVRVPEPSTLLLIAVGVAVRTRMRRGRSSGSVANAVR